MAGYSPLVTSGFIGIITERMSRVFLSKWSTHFFSFLLLSFFFPHAAFGALLYIDPSEARLFRGDTITLGVRLDTDEGECVNAVDVVIEYDASIRAVDVSRGDSILSIWVEDPVIDEENHTITFAGGIPGGYCGRIAGDPRLTNILAELVFRSPGFTIGGGSNKTAKILFDEMSTAYLHDGLGTKAKLLVRGSTLSLSDQPGAAIDDSWRTRVQDDTIPPADFSITLAQVDGAFSGKYFITFNTQDKQSGIDHYEVIEEPFKDFDLFRWGRADAPWVISESPYVLKDQSLNSTIRVKAVDKAGLETIAIYVPDTALRSLSLERTLSFVAVVVIIGGLALLLLYALWRRKQHLIEDYEEHEDA